MGGRDSPAQSFTCCWHQEQSQDSNPGPATWVVGIPSGIFTTVPNIHPSRHSLTYSSPAPHEVGSPSSHFTDKENEARPFPTSHMGSRDGVRTLGGCSADMGSRWLSHICLGTGQPEQGVREPQATQSHRAAAQDRRQKLSGSPPADGLTSCRLPPLPAGLILGPSSRSPKQTLLTLTSPSHIS